MGSVGYHAAVGSNRIPSPVIVVIVQVFSDELTHNKINYLFLRAGAPEPVPPGTKYGKVEQWLRQVDSDPGQDAHAILGRLLEDFMEAQQPPPDPYVWTEGELAKWRERRARVREALAARGLSYQTGGKILGGGVFTPSKTLVDYIRERDLPAVHAEFERAYANIESDPPAAVTAACAILESVCREYIAEESLALPAEQSIHPLWKTPGAPRTLPCDYPQQRPEKDARRPRVHRRWCRGVQDSRWLRARERFNVSPHRNRSCASCGPRRTYRCDVPPGDVEAEEAVGRPTF
jgi:hypothetical protein